MTIFLPVQGLNKLYVIFCDQIGARLSGTKVIVLLLCSLSFTSCKLTRLVPDDSYLLQRNRVQGMDKSATEGELLEQVRHKPNRRVLVFKAHMWANHIGKQIGLNKIGEPPVLIDSNAIERSSDNIHRYLIKKGYFDNEVSYSVDQTRISKALKLRKKRVIYTVDEGRPYKVSRLAYHTDSDQIDSLLNQTRGQADVSEGATVDFDRIGDERDRISSLLRNNGFYSFNPSYIDFVLDTANRDHEVFVDVFIENPDSQYHIKQRIHQVTVVFNTGNVLNDTLRSEKHHLTFVMNGMDISHAVIANNILLKEGDLFRQRNLETTYERLINLNLFSNVGVEIEPRTDDQSLVDVIVMLKPADKFDIIWQPQIISSTQRFNNSQSSRNLGLANEFTLKNKNVFHNGEEFDIHFRTALEMQFTADSSTAFSTFIQEVSTELKIPQLLFFRKKGNSLNINSVRTNFVASYLFETNPFYRRNFFPLSYTYEFADRNFNIAYTPLLISLNQATYKQQLYDQASGSYLQTLERVFTNNLITSQRIGGYYTTQTKKSTQYWVIYSNFLELAGVWLPQLTNYGEKYGVNHSTFIRTDADVRYHVEFNKNNELVFRFFGGIGVPVGNRSVLPYERRFTSGGSNYLRGWRLRTVGPGSFSADDNLQLTRTGEVGLLGNMEYRFNILRNAVDLNGAFFIDMGNVWNLKADTLFPNGEFKLDRFTNEFAINTGIGLRFDFDFLLLRADWGVPLWDPNYSIEERAVIRNAFVDRWIFKRPVWNVAVGYPF